MRLSFFTTVIVVVDQDSSPTHPSTVGCRQLGRAEYKMAAPPFFAALKALMTAAKSAVIRSPHVDA
jgi:hypothetical protein